MDRRNFLVLGGDKRNLALAKLLQKDKHNVFISHIDGIKIKESDIIIGPLPLNDDNKMLNAPFHTEKIPLDTIFKSIKKDQAFIAGKIREEDMLEAKEHDLAFIDYFTREEMQVLNAIPTAEGAIKLAIEDLPITLHGSNVIILGFGRIGKVLAKMLYGIGANVHVGVRSYKDIAWIKSYGYIPIFIKGLNKYLQEMNLVFNTIPTMILNRDLLYYLNKEVLVIDLASKPGGVDFKAAEELGINTIHALAIPGKTAPITAAMIIKETIYNIIEERSLKT